MQITAFSALVAVLALSSAVTDAEASRHKHHGSKHTKHAVSKSGNHPAPKARLATVANSDIQRWLDAHNSVRAQYGAPNLTWSATLVSAAQKEVNTCNWQHTENDQYGENIAAGQTSIEAVVNDWVNGQNEKSAYDPNNPIYSHFTQVVWANTKEIGCAVTTCGELQGAGMQNVQFWACEYNPPGNYIGEFGANVHAGKGGVPLPP